MNHCRLCNHSLNHVWKVKDSKDKKILSIAFCQNCGLVQQFDLPTDESLKTYYSHQYRENYKASHKPKLKHVYRAGITAKNRLMLIKRAVINLQNKKLLDIGAGGGEFCYMATQFGFSEVEGIEPHIGYSEYARKEYSIDIKTRGIYDTHNQSFDIVTMFHVFEHLAHPKEVMAKIWSDLNKDGHLIIEVPNIHQADASPHNIYFKAHLFYYSRYSLLSCASQYFEPVYIEDSSNLLVVFKKREIVLPQMQLPTQEEIAIARARLKQKGWLEYLTKGKGFRKPIHKISRFIQEGKLKHTTPKQVLDHIFSQFLGNRS